MKICLKKNTQNFGFDQSIEIRKRKIDDVIKKCVKISDFHQMI